MPDSTDSADSSRTATSTESTDTKDTPDSAVTVADLVLEGGGVKGIGLVGAVMRMAEQGYEFPRVAGTSAGAIVGAVVVALQRRGEGFDELAEITRTLDYGRFRDRGIAGRLLGPLGFLTDGLSLLLESGV